MGVCGSKKKGLDQPVSPTKILNNERASDAPTPAKPESVQLKLNEQESVTQPSVAVAKPVPEAVRARRPSLDASLSAQRSLPTEGRVQSAQAFLQQEVMEEEGSVLPSVFRSMCHLART